MKHIKVVENPQTYESQNVFVAHLSNIASKDELLKQLKEKLRFPEYFGFNWDALNDCLRDFHWIQEYAITIVHDDLSVLDNIMLDTYLQILFEAIENWKEDGRHSIEVVFPARFENELR